MKIGITGASGFIGKRLVKKLEEDGFEVFKFVRRDVQNENEIFWSPSKQEIDTEKFQTLDAVIHLAGESLAPKDIFGFLPLSGGILRFDSNNFLPTYFLPFASVIR